MMKNLSARMVNARRKNTDATLLKTVLTTATRRIVVIKSRGRELYIVSPNYTVYFVFK